ncbi:hypothetical protein ACFWP5_08905 [Streptomyces sp. NPDC058469]|uniref:hypothetical protein n=1 Tax=Streptomyces sp. NPDC058469 TaxID=3346514 RepID=UPI003669D19E
MSKTYVVAVNCPGYQRFVVEADDKEDAERKAECAFQCDQVGGEAVGEDTEEIAQATAKHEHGTHIDYEEYPDAK